jgi:predicted dehydrogenase
MDQTTTRQSGQLRIGVIGCGKIADAHVEEIRYSAGTDLVAICDIEPVLADQLGDRYGIAKRYVNSDEMLRTERLDIVHITTPPQSHFALTEAAVSAGAHVFIEKPVAFDGAETDRIIQLALDHGKKLSVNYWPNFELAPLRMQKLIESGELGEIVHIESSIGYDLSGAFGQALLRDSSHWVHALPGKLFQNLLDHMVNRVVPLLPAEERPEVHAFAFRRRPPSGTEVFDQLLDELRVYLRAGNVTSYLTFTSQVKPLENILRVYGTKNSAELNYGLRMVRMMHGQKHPSALGRLLPPFQIAGGDLHEGLRNCGEFRRSQARFFYGMHRLLAQFYDSIRTNGEVPIPYQQISSVAHIMDDIHRQVYGELACGTHAYRAEESPAQ